MYDTTAFPLRAVLVVIAVTASLCLFPTPSSAESSVTVRTGSFLAFSGSTSVRNPSAVTENGQGGSTASGPLSLDECIRIALDKNPTNRAALEGVTAAGEAAEAARAPYYPDLSLNLGYRRVQTHAFLPSSISFPGVTGVIGPLDQWNAGVKASYTLFDSGQRRADAQSATAAQKATAADAERTRQGIIFTVTQAYYTLLAAQETKEVAGEHLARSEDHLRLARERKAAGTVPQADVMRAQVEVANARLSLVRAENVVRIARGNLNRTMGLSPSLALAIKREELPVNAPGTVDISEAYAHAVGRRPEIRAANHNITAGENAVKSAKSTFGPKIRAEAGYGWLDSEFLPHDKDWALGISVQWPLFSGFASIHSLARARADLSRKEADREQVILNVQQEVWTAYSNLTESYESVQAAIVAKTDAAESLRLARARYDAGAGTITDLLDTETAMDNAQATYIQAMYTHYIAVAQLKLAVGDL